MKLTDVTELHYIVPHENIPSIMQHGILSYTMAERLGHTSIALSDVQQRRQAVVIPGARPLHEYANLYFDAHNPMLSRLRSLNATLAVMIIDAAVLKLAGTIISDGNASSNYTRFYPSPEGLAFLDKDRIFAPYWLHPDDGYEELRHKREKCAEVLIPDTIPKEFIKGTYVASNVACNNLKVMLPELTIKLNSGMFF